MSESEEVEPTESELADAEALARALEREAGPPETLEQEFETATLLRAVARPELAEERQRAILEEVMSHPLPAATANPRRRFFWWWTLVPFAAAASWMLIVSGESEAGLPDSSALLAAQARYLQGEDAEEYERSLRAFRGEMFASIRQGGFSEPSLRGQH